MNAGTGSKRGLPIPVTIDHVDAEWLSAALGGEVQSAVSERIGEGVGIVGELARIRVTFADPGTPPVTLIAKAHTRAADMLPIATFYGLYTTEVGFYSDESKRFGVRTPLCHYADVSPDGDACIILLEDLGCATVHDQIVGCPLDVADSVIDALAAMHAAAWCDPTLLDVAWLRPVNNAAYRMAGDTIKQGLPVIAARYADLPPDVLDLAIRYADVVPQFLEWSERVHPFTIAHSDLRLDNLFFDHPDGSPVVVIDWQLSVRGPGISDISYFLSMSLTVEHRRLHEQRLVKRWHDALVSHGVTGYSFDDAWLGYRQMMLFQYAISAAAGLVEPANDRAAQLLEVIVRRHYTALDDLLAVELFDEWTAHNLGAFASGTSAGNDPTGNRQVQP